MADTACADRSCIRRVRHAPLDKPGCDPQARGATGQQRPHGLPHIGRQRVVLFKHGIAALEDLRDGHLNLVLYPQPRTTVPGGGGLVQRRSSGAHRFVARPLQRQTV